VAAKVVQYDSGVAGCMAMGGSVWQSGVTHVPLTGAVTASAFGPLSSSPAVDDVHLVIGCEDKSLILHSFSRWSDRQPVSKKLSLAFVRLPFTWV
jgi:hypothetical protein